MTRAALAGFPRALNDLGVMAETGVGGRPTPRAAELYEAAARAGDTLGAWNLADLLLNPGLAPTDPAEGYAWCLWAEDNAPDAGAAAAYRTAVRRVGPAHRGRPGARRGPLRGDCRPSIRRGKRLDIGRDGQPVLGRRGWRC
jgi:TPR repeat protein